jgi:DNA-binding NarL/FixJ family response regulator
MLNRSERPAKELVVSHENRVQLESIARSQTMPALLVRRGQMVLRMADGESNSAVARRLGVSRPTVTLAVRAFLSVAWLPCIKN